MFPGCKPLKWMFERKWQTAFMDQTFCCLTVFSGWPTLIRHEYILPLSSKMQWSEIENENVAVITNAWICGASSEWDCFVGHLGRAEILPHSIFMSRAHCCNQDHFIVTKTTQKRSLPVHTCVFIVHYIMWLLSTSNSEYMTQCFFCDGTSRYGVLENLTTG